MNGSYELTKNEIQNIRGLFGASFYENLLADIQKYKQMWNLEALEMVDYYSVNCIFRCRSKQFGDVVLKIGKPCKETITEYNTLLEYNGKQFCRVIDADIERGVILEEEIKPGTRLREEKSLSKRLSVFSDIFNSLHIKPANSYPTYLGWVCRITDYMSRRDDYKALYIHMKEAQDICLQLTKEYKSAVLLHGDLHHDNILLGKNNEYRIIDPKGVIGDPIFDISRFILNEFYHEKEISYEYYKSHVDEIIHFLSKSLNVPWDIISKCLFIETAMANCWCVESDEAPDMNMVLYARRIML